MRILVIDCDSLRPDHLGCYGYNRDTSSNIDELAANGRRFTNYYTSDSPCLPSRTALFTGRFGIHTGVVNHGGLNADSRPVGRNREFRNFGEFRTFAESLRQAGHQTVMISPFPSRHAAWHVLDGFQTWTDTGGYGGERAGVVFDEADAWLAEHGREEDWYLHVNFWDPHCPYDTPVEYGNPFADDPAPEWLTAETIQEHRDGYGFISARDTLWFADSRRTERTPDEIATREDFKQWIDGYDVGIHYMDSYIGRIINRLKKQGVFEETLIVVTADHGENQGELNVYGDHETADDKTARIPLIMHGPEVASGVDTNLHYHLDLGPTLVELAGGETADRWDGRSFATAVRDDGTSGRDFLVLSQGAWACQRAVRWDDWLCIRTYHDGVKQLDETMLFDLAADPHETNDISEEYPSVVSSALEKLQRWKAARMEESATGENGGNPNTPNGLVDPLWDVICEGGPYHPNRSGRLSEYVQRLEDTGREEHAEKITRQYLEG
ncbi:sulfatase family protein [Halovenus marina]|uniref:sulfatase family protein n=1 Tax=Halovenus marina TaxID=3396621 RepID=UPI003F579BF2